MEKHPLELLTEDYLTSKKFAKVTIKTYRGVYKNFIKYLKDKKIEFPKTSDVIRYKELKRSLGYSSYAIHIDLAALKGLYAYLRRKAYVNELPEFYKHNIMLPVKGERIKPHIKKMILTKDQAKRLLLYTKESRKYLWHYRDYAIISAMLTSGLKIAELKVLKRRDFHIEDKRGIIKVSHDQNQVIMLSHGTTEAIKDYLDKRYDELPYLFVSHKKVSTNGMLSRLFFIEMFQRVLKDAKMDHLGITPHCLRHSAAIMNLLRGGSLLETKKLMRHKVLDSTLLYQDYLNRMNSHAEREIDQFILKESYEKHEEDHLSSLYIMDLF
jgi:site-specific recombinase XerD